ncbi:MAG TPA: hypothetical protein VH108_03930 [Gaiellaceae bacterium]|nr:hypothetical protein [Gaiellaceae bacterium]
MSNAAASKDSDELTPTERASPHLRSLVRYSWLVLLLAVIAAASAVVLSGRETKRYDSTAAVLLTNSEPVNVLLRSTGLPSGDPERDLNTDVALVKVSPVAADVKRILHLHWTNAQLLSEVTAGLSGTSNVLTITVRDISPKRAAAIANAFASSYLSFRRQGAQDAYTQAARLATLRLAALTPQQKKSALGASLRQQLQLLETTGSLQTGASQIVGRAEVPTSPASPRPKLKGAVAGIAGLLIGSLLAIFLGAVRKPKRERAFEDDESGEPADAVNPAAGHQVVAGQSR